MYIKPTNNAVGLEARRSGPNGRNVTIIADFGNGRRQTFTTSRKGLKKKVVSLNSGDSKDFTGNLRGVSQVGGELYFYFEPVDNHDLVVVLKSDVVEALK